MKRKGFFWVKVLFNFVVLCLLSNISCVLPKNDLVLPDVPEAELDNKNSIKTMAAIAEFKSRIKEDPTNTENYSRLAFMYDYIGMYEESLQVLLQKLEYYYGPDWHVLYYNIAHAYMSLDKLDEGKVYLDKALKYRPEDIYNNILLMEYSILKNDHQQAARCMKILSEVSPDKDWYYDTYLKFYSVEDMIDYDFLSLYKKALEENPNNHYAVRAYALMMRNEKGDNLIQEFPNIIKELKRAYKLKPDYVFHRVGIGNTYLWKWELDGHKKSDINQALKWMKKAYALEPTNPKVLYGLGYVYFWMEKEDQAIKFIEKAISQGVKVEGAKDILALAYNNKAYSCYKSGINLDEGMRLIEKALDLFPKDGIMLGTKAELLYKMGKHEEAYEYINKAIALAPGYEEMIQDKENIEKALEQGSK